MTAKIKNLIIQVFRFGIVGGLAFLIDYGILLVLKEIFHIHYLWAAAIAFAISTVFNYWLSVTWVFTEKVERKKTTELAVFVFLSIIGLVINLLCMWLFTDIVHIDYKLSKIAATAIVMIFNFITRKIFLEKKA